MRLYKYLCPLAGLVTLVVASVFANTTQPKVDRLVSRRPHKRAIQDYFNVTIFHVNDIHAHLDQFSEFNSTAANCTNPRGGSQCVGGYARVKDKVDELRPKQNNSLLLNMGDEFEVELSSL
jgi:2',3'-cyclic-nucleotide 2'-phosphodiesterase (5'-nucleotidase family)